MIVVKDLTKRYRGRTVVDRVSFTCEPGTVTGFLGPNGAGKSTTLRMLCGLTTPNGGTTAIGGVAYAALPNPVPVRPNTRSAVILFFLLGLLGGVAVVLGLEVLDASVASRADVEEKLGLAFIGAMPPLGAAPLQPADVDAVAAYVWAISHNKQ